MGRQIKDEDGRVYVEHEPWYKKISSWILILLVLIIAFIIFYLVGRLSSAEDANSKKDSQPSSSSVSKKSESESSQVSESHEDAAASSQTNNDDDGYTYVLNFADGTRRLSRTAPTYASWQMGSASSGSHGRTVYNQMSFKQMGGKTTRADEADTRDEYMQEMNDDYDADSQAMMEKSIPYHE